MSFFHHCLETILENSLNYSKKKLNHPKIKNGISLLCFYHLLLLYLLSNRISGYHYHQSTVHSLVTLVVLSH